MRHLILPALFSLSLSLSALPGLYPTGGIQYLSSVYGPRSNPMGGNDAGSFHFGTDYATRIGTPVIAIKDGTVIVCAYGDRILGKYMTVRDKYGIDLTYAHLSQTWISRGGKVESEETMGLSGSTGQSTGPHLHVQVSMSVDAYLALVDRIETLYSRIYALEHPSSPPEHWRWTK